MKDRIDPLIAERAPWLFYRNPLCRMLKGGLSRLLNYPETIALAHTFADLEADEIMRRIGQMLAQDVIADGLEHLPATGPALIAANHPTGIADGIILRHVLARVRSDIYFFANADMVRVLPQLATQIVPVEWRQAKRSHAKTRAAMEAVDARMAAGQLGVIFPSGRLAKRRGLTLHERPWMPSVALLAHRYEVPIVPVRIEARNSPLFYILDAIHPTLRDVTLFHETLNKDRQPFRIGIGAPIESGRMPPSPRDGIVMIRDAVMALRVPRAAASAPRGRLARVDLSHQG